MRKYCKICEKTFEENAKYCPNCGAGLVNDEDEKYTEYTTDRRYDSRRPKEKVRFSHQLLIPKLMAIGIFRLFCVSSAIDSGVMSVLTGEGWIDLIIWGFVTIFFSAWFTRNIVNYSGSDYLITFGIKKETLGKIENTLKITEKICLLIVGIIYGIFFIKRFSLNVIFSAFVSFELFSIFLAIVTPIVLAVADVEGLILIVIIIDSLRDITSVYRTITKKDLEKAREDINDTKFLDDMKEKIFETIDQFLN
jgi:hypothetical protein